jgi:hypothetical protein
MNFESFIGAIWFSGLTAVLGYLAGHIFPISYLTGLFKK